MAEDILKAIFRIQENFFQSFPTKFLSLIYRILLAYKISHCLSFNDNQELRGVICTSATLFALVLHLNCTALSQSESRIFFMCMDLNVVYIYASICPSKTIVHGQVAESATPDEQVLASRYLYPLGKMEPEKRLMAYMGKSKWWVEGKVIKPVSACCRNRLFVQPDGNYDG